MTEQKAGEQGVTDNGGAAGNGNNAGTDERAKWTPEQWADFAQREADRRVTEAQKKWREDLTAQLTAKDRDAEQRIAATLEKAKQAETRAAFVERANDAGVADLRAAWAVVREYGLADDKGRVDFDKLKADHPTLFAGQKPVRSVAGTPGDTGNNNKLDMTALIRQSALRR